MLYRWFGGSNKVKSEYDEFKFDLESSEYEMRVVSSKKKKEKGRCQPNYFELLRIDWTGNIRV